MTNKRTKNNEGTAPGTVITQRRGKSQLPDDVPQSNNPKTAREEKEKFDRARKKLREFWED